MKTLAFAILLATLLALQGCRKKESKPPVILSVKDIDSNTTEIQINDNDSLLRVDMAKRDADGIVEGDTLVDLEYFKNHSNEKNK